MNTESDILAKYRVVAVVGLSPNEERASYHVAVYLQAQGYKVIPVNPSVEEILGERCYPDLAAVPHSVEVVDIFRRSSETSVIVEQAIKIGAKAIWMQEGVVNEDAAAKAQSAGLSVVMDKCMMREHRRAMLLGPSSGQ